MKKSSASQAQAVSLQGHKPSPAPNGSSSNKDSASIMNIRKD